MGPIYFSSSFLILLPCVLPVAKRAVQGPGRQTRVFLLVLMVVGKPTRAGKFSFYLNWGEGGDELGGRRIRLGRRQDQLGQCSLYVNPLAGPDLSAFIKSDLHKRYLC